MQSEDKKIINNLLQLIARGRFDVSGEGALQIANIVSAAQKYVAAQPIIEEVKEDD